ncbi:hypothetical protein GOV05_02635 [Candidatus Woesearchaeota archaeon]|nr:hypothetical protein [Candidatus Woesearchaeota archaeon]
MGSDLDLVNVNVTRNDSDWEGNYTTDSGGLTKTFTLTEGVAKSGYSGGALNISYWYNVTYDKIGYYFDWNNFTIDHSGTYWYTLISMYYPTNLSTNTSGAVYIGEQVTIYANYTNQTNNAFIPSAHCNLTLQNSSSYTMNQDASLYNYTLTYNQNGTFSYNVTCNLTSYQTRNVTGSVTILNDSQAPSLTIIEPISMTYLISNITLNISVFDAENHLDSCWYHNGTINKTILNCNDTWEVLTNAAYNFTFFVNDTFGNINSTWVNFTVLNDTTAPNVTLITPNNDNVTTTTNTILFEVNISDESNVTNCSLVINNTVRETEDSINTSETDSFTYTLSNGYYNWGVQCTDEYNNTNTLETRNLTIQNYQLDVCVNLTTPNQTYTLTTNLTSNGTCIEVKANNTVLDCQGRSINYTSLGPDAYGVKAQSKNNVSVKNCLIFEKDNAFDGNTPIYFLDVIVGEISNNELITFTSSPGVHASLSHNLSINYNNIITNDINVRGIQLFTTHNCSLSNINITSHGTNFRGVYLSDSIDNTFEKISVYSNQTSNYGLEISGFSKNNDFRNIETTLNGTNSIGVYIATGQNLTFTDNYFNVSNGYDITTTNVAAGIYDFINTTLNTINFSSSAAGQLNVYWYLDYNVTNMSSMPVNNSNITVFDKDNNYLYNLTTDNTGLTGSVLSKEYSYNASGKQPKNPYNVTITHQEYDYFENSSVNFTTNTLLSFVLNTSDQTNPGWADNKTSPISPAVYNESGVYEFNVSWYDNVMLDTVLFFENFTTPTWDFHTTTNTSYNYSYTHGPIAAGSYEWRMWANDTSGNDNQTINFSYVIQRVNLTLNLSIQNQTINRGDNTLINCSSNTAQVTRTLYRNNSGPITNPEVLTDWLGAGTYNYTCNATQSQNYTADSKWDVLTVLQDNTTLTMIPSSSFSVKNQTPTNIGCSASNEEVNITLYRNNTLVVWGVNTTIYDPQILSVGTHNYICNNTASQNYTADSTSILVTVTPKNTTSCSLDITPFGSTTYPNLVTATCSCDNPEATPLLYRNNTEVTPQNGTAILLAADTYDYVCNVSETQNYTAAFNQSTYLVIKGTPVINLTLNGTADNISVERRSTVQINASITTPNTETVDLINDTGPVATNIVGSQIFSIDFNQTGIYNYTLVFSGNQNYTAQNITYSVNVTDNTPPSNITFLYSPSQGTNWVFWVWTNPSGEDDLFLTNLSVNAVYNTTLTTGINMYNLTDLSPNTTYTLSLRPIDIYNNAGLWTNATNTTRALPNTPPNVVLFEPVDGVQINDTLNITFNYTATDSQSTTLNCTLYVNSFNVSTNIVSNSTPILVNHSVPSYNQSYSWYVNCSDGLNHTISLTYTFSVEDTIPPNIFNVNASSITNESAIINWNTDTNATTVLDYGLTVGLELTAITQVNQSNVTNHSINLLNLTSNTTYYYQVTSCDMNTSVVCNSSIIINFKTLANPVVNTPPTVSLVYPITSPIIQNNRNMTLTYAVVDDNNTVNCSLIFDGTRFNATNISTGTNSYNVTNVSYYHHNWTVNCTDGQFSDQATPYTFLLGHDNDGDGYYQFISGGPDCDDTPISGFNVNPGQTESCGNLIDDNCDGNINEGCGGGGGGAGPPPVVDENVSIGDNESDGEEIIIILPIINVSDNVSDDDNESEVIIIEESPNIIIENNKDFDRGKFIFFVDGLTVEKGYDYVNDTTRLKYEIVNNGLIKYDRVALVISIPKTVVQKAVLLKGSFQVLEEDPKIFFLEQIIFPQEVRTKTFTVPRILSIEEIASITHELEINISDEELGILELKAEDTDKFIDTKINVTVEDNKTKVRIELDSDNEVDNLTVYIEIPKCLAKTLKEIHFEKEEYEVIKDDPLVAFFFKNLEDITPINFEVLKEVDPDCWKKIKTLPIADRIGHKILVVENEKLYLAIGIVLLINFLVLGFNALQKRLEKHKDKGFFHKIEFGLIETILILIITINVMDFLKILTPDLDFAKKILSWSLLALLLYEVNLEKIFYGKKSKYEMLIFLAANFLLMIRVFLDVVFVAYNEIVEERIGSNFIVLYQKIVVFELANPGLIAGYGMLIGFSLLVLLSFFDVFKNIRAPSLLAALHIEGRPKNLAQRVERFVISLVVYLAFFILFFNFFMEWLAVSVDAAIIVLAIIIYVMRFIKRHMHHYREEHLINKIGMASDAFYEKFINLFRYHETILFGLSGILVLHLLVDVGNYMVPFLLNVKDVLYSAQLGLGHYTLVSILKSLYTTDLVQNVLITINYLLNTLFILICLAFPGYLWYDIYMGRAINIKKRYVALFTLAITNYVLQPLIWIRDIDSHTLIGVHITFKTVLAQNQALILGISVAAAIVAFILSYNIILRTILKLSGATFILMFFFGYVYYYAKSWTQNLFPQIIEFLISNTPLQIFLGILLSAFLGITLLFYATSYVYFTKLVYSEWFVKKYTLSHLMQRYRHAIKALTNTKEEERKLIRTIHKIDELRKRRISDPKIREYLYEHGIKKEVIDEIIYL